MAKLPIDLKHFKKTASDKNTTTLTHKDGHQLKIAHGALGAEMKSALKALPLAEGGEVKDPSQEHLGQGDKQPNAIEKELVSKTRKELPHYDEGTPDGGVPAQPQAELPPEINQNSSQMPEQAPQEAARQQPQIDPALQEKRSLYNSLVSQEPTTMEGKVGVPNADQGEAAQFGPNGEAPKAFDANAWNKAEANFNNQKASQTVATGVDVAKIMEQNKARVAAGLDPLPVPAAPQQQNPSLSGPANMPAPQTPEQQQAGARDTYGLQGMAQAFQKGADQSLAGIHNEASAIGQQGKAESQVLGNQLQIQQHLMDQTTQKVAENETEYNNFVHDVQNQHIDPSHYMNSLGTASKVSTGIGLLLGGIGGAITGQENPALAMINKSIDRDIDAQKANLGKSENLLSANLHRFGNIRDAAAMTQAMQAGIVINQLKQAEANAKDPIAKARAQQAAGALYMDKVAPNLRMIGMNQAMMSTLSGSQNDPDKIGQTIQAMRVLNPAMAKSMEERYVPGIGMSNTTPIPQAVRETLVAKQQLNNMATDFYKWASQHSGSLDPRVVNEGKTKAAELQSLYRNSINGGVFKKGEQDFIDNIIDSDPTKFFNQIRVLPKLKEVINNNNGQFEALKHGYGLPSGNNRSPQSSQSGGFTPKSFKPSK